MVGRIAVSAEYKLVYNKWLEVEGSGGPNFPLRSARDLPMDVQRRPCAQKISVKDFDFFWKIWYNIYVRKWEGKQINSLLQK